MIYNKSQKTFQSFLFRLRFDHSGFKPHSLTRRSTLVLLRSRCGYVCLRVSWTEYSRADTVETVSGGILCTFPIFRENGHRIPRSTIVFVASERRFYRHRWYFRLHRHPWRSSHVSFQLFLSLCLWKMQLFRLSRTRSKSSLLQQCAMDHAVAIIHSYPHPDRAIGV